MRREPADYVVLAAAVADYAPAEVSDKKIKRENKDEVTLRLVRNPDIAAAIGERKKRAGARRVCT